MKPGALRVIPTPQYTYNTLVLTTASLHLSSRNWLLVLFLVLKSLRLVYKQNNRMEWTDPAAFLYGGNIISTESLSCPAAARQMKLPEMFTEKCTKFLDFKTNSCPRLSLLLTACSLPRVGPNKIVLSVRLTVRLHIRHNWRNARWIFILHIGEF